MPQIIKNDILLNNKPNLVTITEEQISAKVKDIIEERFGNM